MNLLLQERIERTSVQEPNTGCWLWLGSLGATGYGTISVGSTKTSAHRASYIAFVGEIPEGKIVLHRCDTKSCVNPQHLSIGTHHDNALDRSRRGRVSGETDEQRRAWGVKGADRGSLGLGLDLKDRLDRLSVSEPNTGCQLWIGTVVKSTGYGEIKVGGKKTSAHRAAWIAHRGEVPVGMVVMHRCDVRACINIEHLSVGSRQDNSTDMASKRRGGFDKLTREQRVAMMQRAVYTLGPDGLKARAAVRAASMTPEQRSEAARKRAASMTPERRSEISLKGMSSEQRSETFRKIWAAKTPEHRSEIARKRAAAMTPEQRKTQSAAGREAVIRLRAKRMPSLRFNLLVPRAA